MPLRARFIVLAGEANRERRPAHAQVIEFGGDGADEFAGARAAGSRESGGRFSASVARQCLSVARSASIEAARVASVARRADASAP